jgi:hypothetical protein
MLQWKQYEWEKESKKALIDEEMFSLANRKDIELNNSTTRQMNFKYASKKIQLEILDSPMNINNEFNYTVQQIQLELNYGAVQNFDKFNLTVKQIRL